MIEIPVKGWEPETYYVVDYASEESGGITRGILYSGLLVYTTAGKEGYPGRYSKVWDGGESEDYGDVTYLKIHFNLNNMSLGERNPSVSFPMCKDTSPKPEHKEVGHSSMYRTTDY